MSSAAAQFKTPSKPLARPHDVFPASVYTELKRTIAAESFRQFSDKDMTITKQKDACFNHYHGLEGLVSQISKFVEGKALFGNLWENTETTEGPCRVIPELLHRQTNKLLVAGTNLNPSYLDRQFKLTGTLLSGRTARTYALDITRESKKMLTLMGEAVKEKILVKDGDEYIYFSGKNQRDFVDFILFRMYNWKYFNGPSGAGMVSTNPTAKGGDTMAGNSSPTTIVG